MRVADPAQGRVRIVLTAVVACILGLTYLQVKDTQGTVMDRQAVIFGCLVFLTMNTMITTAIIFPLEKAFIFREYHNGTYRLFAWYSANLLASLLMQLLYSTVYVIVLYFLVGLRPGASHFLTYWGVCSLMGSIGVVLGTLLGIMLPAVHMVTAVVPPAIMPQLIFSGFMVRPANIPIYFKWLYYVSFFQYSFRILLTDQFKGFEFDNCNFGEFCPLGFGIQQGDVWIEGNLGYSLTDDAIRQCWFILLGMVVGFVVLGYWVTKLKAASG